MKLSVVSTLYNSSPYVGEFVRRAGVAASQVTDNYEIILVNDGSDDDSLETALHLMENEPRLTVVDLSRNFGHHKAMMTGLEHAEGDLVFLVDSDLEEEPEWLLDFGEELRKTCSDMVYGVQIRRKGGVVERVTGALYYRLFSWLTNVNQPDNIVTARLMTRRYVQALLGHRERELNIGGLWIITGFKQSSIRVSKGAHSPTTYTWPAKVSHVVNAITSFSSKPLIATFYTGASVFISASLYVCYLIARYLIVSSAPSGYTSLIVSVWFFSGLIIVMLGIQGIYLSKVFTEVKGRPYTITRQVFRRPK